MRTTLFDLLGIPPGTPTARMAAARALWPASRVHSTRGATATPDPSALLEYLQSSLEFLAVRPGAGPAAVGVEAEVRVVNAPTRQPIVLAQLPDIEFHLVDTVADQPARLYAVMGDGGVELVIEALPVEIRLPTEVLAPLRTREEERTHPAGGPDVTLGRPFQPGMQDSLEVTLREPLSSSIKVHLKVRVTEERDVIIEPAVPLSFGPCRFLGMPALGVHDLGFVPSPRLTGAHDPGEQALEWARHPLDRLSVGAPYTGVLTVRTVDLDNTRPPLDWLAVRMNRDRPVTNSVEFVLQDIAVPAFGMVNLPVPAHGMFGLRRPITEGRTSDEAFTLAAAPVQASWREPFAGRLYVDQLLARTPASLDPLDQFLFLQMALYVGNDAEQPQATGGGPSPRGPWRIGIADDWTVQAGWGLATGATIFTIADADVKFWGAKLGLSIKRVASKDPQYEWHEMFQVLLDLGLTAKPTSFGTAFQLRSLSGKQLEVVLRDVGWNLGSLDLSGLSFPEGVQLVFGNVVRFVVEELAWLTENNGGRYFSFTGGVEIFPGMGRTNRSPTVGSGSAAIREEEGNGVGIRFRRLRFKIGGNPEAPAMLLDGVSLKIALGPVKLTGFGMVSEFTESGHNYNELGFGLKLEVGFGPARLQIGAQLFYGRVRGPVDNFTYWVFGFQVSPIPLGSFSLKNVRALFAGNMQPSLPPPDGYAQNMRILRWYRDNEGGVDMPANRKLAAWKPKDRSAAFGAGLGIALGAGDCVTVDGFFFWHNSPEENGLLVLVEVYLGRGTKPVAFGAVELDMAHGRWGVMLGVELSLETILNATSAWLRNLGSLTGTLYFGNEPGTFAIGRLSDPSTWLTLRFGNTGILDCGVTIAVCLEIVDRDEGPRGFGLLASVKGAAVWGIGVVQAYANLSLLVGVWRNESSAAGFEARLQAGIRVKVFFVFNFGIHVGVEFIYLGASPAYRRLSCEFRIETPWWLPDVTFRLEKVWDTPRPDELDTVSSPIVAAAGLNPGTQSQATLGVTPVTGAAVDPKAVYSLDTLRGLPAPSLGDAAIAGLEPVGADAVVAIELKQPVDNKTVAPATPAGAGTQQAQQLDITYELVSIGIRRRPRFGALRVWSDLVASGATRLETPADFPPATELEAWFEATNIGFRWDVDMQSAGRLDPRRLLINASTPYSFATINPTVDESTAATDPGWPCCRDDDKDREPTWHTLDFAGVPFGVRASTTQSFTDSTSTWQWRPRPTPVVVPGRIAPSSVHVAPVDLPFDDGVVVTVSFDTRVAVFELSAFWGAFELPGARLVVDAYDGLDLVDSVVVPLSGPHSGSITVTVPRGMTAVVVRLTGARVPRARFAALHAARAAAQWDLWLEIAGGRYRTVEEVVADRWHDALCERQGGEALDGGGRLAWLPNHEYEVALEVRVVVGYAASGKQDTRITQKAYFLTKGLPGLNAVRRIGDELEPYVESRYGGPAPHRLYRREPVALAFNEHFNILVPVDRVPSPSAPAERNQLLEWTLAVERVAGGGEARRVSVTSADWVVEHRASSVEIDWRPVVNVTGALHVSALTRSAPTLDPARLRLEGMATRPGACPDPPSLRRSQVLLHQPVDPGHTGPDPQAWEPNASYRVNVRVKGAPYVERRPFAPIDATAFEPADHGRMSGTAWSGTGGALRVVGAPADDVHRFAVFGENTWDHVQVLVDVDPGAGRAGVAFGVAGLPNVTQAMLALVGQGSLRILELRGSAVTELAATALPAGAAGPFALRAVAYDDKVVAEAAGVSVEAPRRAVRAGRLALVARNGGVFSSLVVDSLDAYRFEVQTSRFETFEAHVDSFDGRLGVWAPPTGVATETVASLLTATASAFPEVMAARSDREARQRVFDRWVAGLAVPLAKGAHAPERLTVTRIGSGAGTDALLLEGPEPLPFSEDVTLVMSHWVQTRFPLPGGDRPWSDLFEAEVVEAVRRAGGIGSAPTAGGFDPGVVAVRPRDPLVELLDGIVTLPSPLPVGHWQVDPVRVLTDGDECRALVVPVDAAGQAAALASDRYRMRFALDRSRWRTATPDATSNYRSQADVFVTW